MQQAIYVPRQIDLERIYYLSGPMSNYPEYNYPAFARIKSKMEGRGFKVESPHENEWPKNHKEMKEKDLWQYMMDAALKQMERCSALMLMQGWVKSRGAKREFDVATEYGWPIYFYRESLHWDEVIDLNDWDVM